MATLDLHIVVKGRNATLQAIENTVREFVESICNYDLVSADYEIAGGLVEKEGCDGEEEPAGVSDSE